MSSKTDIRRMLRILFAFLAVYGTAIGMAVWTFRRSDLTFFDDAYMFYRYAINIRHYLGVSWNLDGVHTYGMTSLTWQFLVWVMSFLRIKPAGILIIASTLTFCAAVTIMAKFIQQTAKSQWLSRFENALLAVALPLVLQYVFLQNVTNGMDTMLSLLMSGLIGIVALSFAQKESWQSAVIAGGVGYLAQATRPEAELCALLLPVLAFFFMSKRRSWMPVLIFLATNLGLVSIQLLCAKLYFGTALPLAFYLKSKTAYEGFTGYGGPVESLFNIFSLAAIYLLLLVFFSRKRHRALLFIFLGPALLTTVYLSTVTQIMGIFARYYIPLLPYIILPALIVFDEALASEDFRMNVAPARLISILGVIVLLSYGNVITTILRSETRYLGRHTAIIEPILVTAATRPLPVLNVWDSLHFVGRKLGVALPAGATIAASEVGFVGAAAPRVNVIDLAGLNDTQIALNGFKMSFIFDRKPDVLWLPHPAYSGLRAAIFNDPRFLVQYDVLAGAYSFGIGIRKDSPYHDLVLNEIAASWPTYYPEFRMDDYFVQSVKTEKGITDATQK